MSKILFIIGTRPEAIKMAPVILKFKQDEEFEVKICSTGQHREMLDQVFDFFQLKIDFELALMRTDQALVDLTASILKEATAVLKSFQPDWVIVQGDTTSALAGAMAAFYEKIKIAHIEAGLRSHDMKVPFPEEMNRSVISKLADCHFCPTQKAVENLKREGVIKNVFNVGNTVVDSVLQGVQLVETNYVFDESLFGEIDFTKRIILVTCHRRESFGEPFINICQALVEIADQLIDCEIVYPVHLNPNILDNAKKYLLHPRIHLIKPLTYPNLLWLLSKAHLVLTDSGGIQEEAPSLNKPVLVLRDVTERMEGIEAGTARLVGTNTVNIVTHTLQLMREGELYKKMKHSINPYGDGQTSERILKILKEIR
jgi:UDP-N-acetylglucosamine 2-epimerase (non-hydrolysing)